MTIPLSPPAPSARPAASAPAGKVPGGKALNGKVPAAKTKFGGVAVVCAKCAKRQGLRPKALRALLRDAYRTVSPAPERREGKEKGKARKLCVVESGCLGPCPKHAVAVATGASLAAGRVLLLDPKAGARAPARPCSPNSAPMAH